MSTPKYIQLPLFGNDDPPLKRCSRRDKCINPRGPFLPPTLEFFSNDKSKVDKLTVTCRVCRQIASINCHIKYRDSQNAARRARYAENPDKYRAYWDKNKDKYKARAKERYLEDSEHRKEASRKWYRDNPERAKQSKRLYYQNHKSEARIARRRYYHEHIERSRENGRNQYLKRIEKTIAYTRKWRRENSDKVRSQKLNRRARINGLAYDFTSRDWFQCKEYWSNKCAYCDTTSDGTFRFRLTADHWIPVTNPECPGTILGNIVPCCQACNSSKNNTDPLKWLHRKFGERADDIEHGILEYFKQINTLASMD